MFEQDESINPEKPKLNLYDTLKAQPSVTELIKSAGNTLGVSNKLMYSIGMVESNLNPKAQAGTSSAKGLYQFTKGTWNSMVAKYGTQYGIPEGTLRGDAAANAILGAAYIKDNQTSFKGAFGEDRELSSTDAYLGHFLGSAGRNKFIKGMDNNPEALGIDLVGARQAKANFNIFYNKDGSPRTAQQVYSNFSNKLDSHETAEDLKSDGIEIPERSPMSGAVTPYHNEEEEAGANPMYPDYKAPDAPQLDYSDIFPQEMSEGGTTQLPPVKSDAFNKSYEQLTPISNTPTFSDSATFTQPEEENSMFDGTWDTVKASAAYSAVGMAADTKLKEFGISPISPEVLGLFDSLGEDTGDALQFFDPKFEVTQDLIDKAKELGVTDDFIPFITNGSYNEGSFKIKVQQALDNQKRQETVGKSGWAAQLTGGVVEAGLDPISYATGGATKATGFLAKMGASAVEQGLNGGVAEAMREDRTGLKADYVNAVGGAVLFGTTFHLIGEAASKSSMGTVLRLESRQESLNADIAEDISRSTTPVPEGEDFIPHPTEAGSVILKDGTVISGTNPSNPLVQKLVEEMPEQLKANKGIPLHDLDSINQTLWHSKDKAAQAIVADLMRSSTGIKGGGTGASRVVADDIIKMMEGRDNQFAHSFREASKAAKKGLVDQNDELLNARIITAIEQGNVAQLRPEEAAMAKVFQDQMVYKYEQAMNPQKFGREEAVPVFTTKRDPNKQVPLVYDEGKVNAFKAQHGTDKLHENIKSNWLAQLKANHNDIQKTMREMFEESAPEAKQKVKVGTPDRAVDLAKVKEDYDAAFMKWAEEYIEKKSYGISHNGEFVHTAFLEDVNINETLTGIQNNNFSKERQVFDASYVSVGELGDFSLNDIRLSNLEDLASMYNRRINGDIAIHGATGKTTNDLKAAIENISDRKTRKAADGYLKLITGRARREPDGALGEILRALTDTTTATKGTMMWHLQALELAGWTADRTMKIARGGIPALKHLFNPEAKFSMKDRSDFRAALFGKELNTLLRTSYKGYRESFESRGMKPSVAIGTAAFRQSASYLVNKAPWMKALNKTQELLVDLARNGVIGDVTDAAMLGIDKFKPEYLKNASITPEQYSDILKLIKKHTKIVDGDYKADVKAIVKDPISAHLWRLGDYVANDQVFSANRIGDNFVATPNGFGAMALNFKSFMLKGLNSKSVKMFHEARNGRGLDHSLQLMLGTMMSGAMYAAQVHYRAMGVPEDDREEYLNKYLNPSLIAYQAFARGSILGAPLGVVNMVGDVATGNDIFTAGRTTLTGAREDDTPNGLRTGASTSYATSGRAARTLGNQLPAFGTVTALGSLGINTANYLGAEEGYESASYGKAMISDLKSVGFNDPMYQKLINNFGESIGVLDKMN